VVDNFNLPIVEALTRTTIKIPHDKGLWQHDCYRFLCNRLAIFSLVLLLLIVAWTLLAPLFSPFGYDEIYWKNFWLQPNFTSGHYFSTDILGRDLLVRTAVGGKTTLSIGIISSIITVLIGVFYGIIAGYFEGWLEILNSFPSIFLVILLGNYFERGTLLVLVAIGSFSWLNVAYISRGQTRILKQKEFILTAQTYGRKPFNIMISHILPNLLGVIIVYASLLIPSLILFESFISFLGLGVQEPMVSLGNLIQSAASTLEYTPWSLIFPGSYLALILWCFNVISDALRDALEP
jgi:oligopeptide transport system permease protein